MIEAFKSIVSIFVIIFVFFGVKAEEVYFDLSEDNIAIKTDFDGKEIIIFGLLQDDHDTLITIKGPLSKMKIQKKERYFGVWINNKQITYSKIPTLFFLSTSSKIDEILPNSIQINDDLNFDKIYFSKRIFENLSYLTFTNALNLLYESKKPIAKSLIKTSFSVLNKTPFIKNLFIRQAMGKINLV